MIEIILRSESNINFLLIMITSYAMFAEPEERKAKALVALAWFLLFLNIIFNFVMGL